MSGDSCGLLSYPARESFNCGSVYRGRADARKSLDLARFRASPTARMSVRWGVAPTSCPRRSARDAEGGGAWAEFIGVWDAEGTSLTRSPIRVIALTHMGLEQGETR